MPINVTCGGCGKSMNAKDEFAGRKTKCPGCGGVLVIPEPVYDAEYVDDEYGDGGGYADADTDYEDDGYEAADAGDRKPCRACGELIKRTALKCRFCGEVFDKSIGKRGGRGAVDRETIKKFRREMHGLGGLWIFFAILVTGVGIAAFGGNIPNVDAEAATGLGVIMLLLAALWGVVGIFTCLKHMWAV